MVPSLRHTIPSLFVLASAAMACGTSVTPLKPNLGSGGDDSQSVGNTVNGTVGSSVSTTGSGGAGGAGGMSPISCLSETKCVTNSDCSSGYHCNTALTPPQCEQLYCGQAGTACSELADCVVGLFCTKGLCVATPPPPTYPVGPYGIDQGNVIPNFALQGFPTPQADMSTLVAMSLGDFYNPTTTAVFPATSPYGAGKPMPKALVIHLAAVWAAPSNEETKTVTPMEYAMYAPLGGGFLDVLIDGPTPGAAPTAENLTNWTKEYAVAYPAAIDPSDTIRPLLMAFPTNLVVDTKTMTVAARLDGLPVVDDPFWTTYAGVVSAP